MRYRSAPQPLGTPGRIATGPIRAESPQAARLLAGGAAALVVAAAVGGVVDLGGQRGLEVLVDAGLVEQLVLGAAARGVRAGLGEVHGAGHQGRC